VFTSHVVDVCGHDSTEFALPIRLYAYDFLKHINARYKASREMVGDHNFGSEHQC
jgi:hypothetical protein